MFNLNPKAYTQGPCCLKDSFRYRTLVKIKRDPCDRFRWSIDFDDRSIVSFLINRNDWIDRKFWWSRSRSIDRELAIDRQLWCKAHISWNFAQSRVGFSLTRIERLGASFCFHFSNEVFCLRLLWYIFKCKINNILHIWLLWTFPKIQHLNKNTSFEKWKQNEAPRRSMRVRLKPTRLWAKFQEKWAVYKLL